jgi:hypothetical protein
MTYSKYGFHKMKEKQKTNICRVHQLNKATFGVHCIDCEKEALASLKAELERKNTFTTCMYVSWSDWKRIWKERGL